MNPNLNDNSVSPASWGSKSGEVTVGPLSGGALWMKRDAVESQTGYAFDGSFMIANAGLANDTAITMFVSKPADWSGPLAAWRLYFRKQDGQLSLVLVLGLNTAINNPSGAVYTVPIKIDQAHNVGVVYDTKDRFYLWTLDGKLEAVAKMPADYPLIGTQIIGSSGSSDGRDSQFIVDNVDWQELPRSFSITLDLLSNIDTLNNQTPVSSVPLPFAMPMFAASISGLLLIGKFRSGKN